MYVGTKNYTTNNYIETWRFEPEKPGSAEHGRQYVMNNRFVYLNFYRSFVDGSSFTAQTQSLYSIDSKWVFNIGTTYNFNGYWSKRITSIQIFGIAFMNYNTDTEKSVTVVTLLLFELNSKLTCV